MKVIYGKEFIKGKKTIVGLGSFDGIHIGHATLINTIINYAKISNLHSLIYTFEKHPNNIIRKEILKPVITTNRQKEEILSKTELDILYFDEFTDEYSRMSPEDFAEKVIRDRLNAKHVVVGYNYKFGYKAQGSVDELREFGEEYKFDVTVIPPVKSGRATVSSSLIRQKIAEGDIQAAYNLLGRYFSITGNVQPGKRIGRKLGVPTANIHLKPYLLLPPNGVYATRTLLKGRLYNSITNIGVNPTVNFSEVKMKIMETHILDFSQNIYDEYIEVFFIKKLRDEQKFNDKEELAYQLKKDMNAAKQVLDRF